MNITPRAVLERLAQRAPAAVPAGPAARQLSGESFDLRHWIHQQGLTIAREGTWNGGHRWVLRDCPFNPDHTDAAAYIVQLPSGAIAAGCHHNSCTGMTWQTLREQLEPDRQSGSLDRVGAAANYSTEVLYEKTKEEAQWPEPPASSVLRGLAGRIVETVDPFTEADPYAVLVQLLTAFGCAVGTSPHALVGATRHSPRLFTALVGRTSKARKGDSWQPVKLLFTRAGTDVTPRVQDGLSSGEGLIFAVRDPVEERKPVREKGRVVRYESVVTDPGEPDKRLLLIEPEFARVLRVMGRQGNTLSAVPRAAWDSGNLRIMTRNSPLQATNAHIAIVGHITVDELRRELADTEAANGFANRFIWLLVRRSKDLPEPKPFDGPVVDKLAEDLRQAVRRARGIQRLERDDEARELWHSVYSDLAAERPGLAAAIAARAEANVLRLSLIYALLDGSSTVKFEHLEAALELWAYAERCVEHVFGDATGDPVADALMSALRQNGELTRSQIHDLFGRNESAGRITRALQVLLRAGCARAEQRSTGGRPAEVWLPA